MQLTAPPPAGLTGGGTQPGHQGQAAVPFGWGPLPTTPIPTPLGDCVQMAKQAPSRPPSAVESCSLAALHLSKPARSRMAKSPT